MNTTALMRPPSASGRAVPRSDARHNGEPAASDHPTFGEMLVVPSPLVRRLHGQRARHAFIDDHAAQLIPVDSPRVVT
jgi:hypothetical protein